MSVLQIAPSVVALQSLTGEPFINCQCHLLLILVQNYLCHDCLMLFTAGETQLFSCSGTIVEVSEGIGLIVTVANLVKSPDADERAEKLKVGPSLCYYW